MIYKPNKSNGKLFIDLFSGCGGLSLGLMQAGWTGVFAVEKTTGAFNTLKHNLIDGSRYRYSWPEWLPTENMEVGILINKYKEQLIKLRGRVALIAGGPPCQGFSMAGRRDPNDPRNRLAEEYIEVVKLVRPKYLLLENVRGFNTSFSKGKGNIEPYSKVVKALLEDIGYGVSFQVVKSSDWGIPQHRPRFILIAKLGVKSEDFKPFTGFSMFRERFLKKHNLPINRETTVKDAIADLEIHGRKLIQNEDSGIAGFWELDYQPPTVPNGYLKYLRESFETGVPNSLRLPRHTDRVKERFRRILTLCPKGVTIQKKYRDVLEIKKQAFTPLHPDMPSATVTTLPDDILHYCEPRILTVRENARLQSFPDWFEFRDAYTTGGVLRKSTCPRYTQVGNAVPPLLGRALGEYIRLIDEAI
ncbi:MAG: DNA cytosine methyltransferase [Aeromonas sobria]|uniref:DNA cytosine methyltransferase n=1 Tax=Aeromonas sobria TaxID=646 RepID=UPI003F36C865